MKSSRRQLACVKVGQMTEDHFPDVRKMVEIGSDARGRRHTPSANRRAQARTMGGSAMSDLLSNGMAGGFSVVKESLTTQVLSRMVTIRKSRRVGSPEKATIRNFRIVRFLRRASYSENLNSWYGVVRNSRRTDLVYALCLNPSNSMGLESPTEVYE